MELRQLRYLALIADEANFTRAAEKLFVTQSALSQQIQKLEEEVGIPLLDRTSRQVRLTAAGEILLGRARNVFDELDAAHLALREMQGIQRGSIRLGAVQTVNAYFVPQAISLFMESYPNIEMVVEELPANEIEQGLHSGRLQLGIGFVPVTSPNIDGEALFAERLVIIVSANHPLAGCHYVTPADIEGLPMALLPKTYCTRRLWDSYAAQSGLASNIRLEMNTISSLLATVSRTSLATILPQSVIQQHTGSPLSCLRFDHPSLRRTVGMLWHRHRYRCAASLSFAQVVRDIIELESTHFDLEIPTPSAEIPTG
ncbi:MAG TPA: transcriptional regulator CynR [Aggregatilineales bacterium]|nr:transcriptional regulator CynR [Anaerolineales bacterium]HRE49691.1 transcriptional regulator CynR [Aggregatilineales bacterium]